MANFWAFLKAIPGLVKVFLSVKEAYDKWQLKKIENHYTQKQNAKSRLAKEIKNATTDEQRAEFARRLNNLTNS